MIDGPVVQVEHAPQSHVVDKTFEIPQLDVVEKIVETPETQTFQGTQTFVSLNTAEQTAAKDDLEADTAKHSSILETAMSRRSQTKTESRSAQWSKLLMSLYRRWWNRRRSFSGQNPATYSGADR